MPSTYSSLVYHVVFATRGRTPSITPDLRDGLYRFIAGVVRHEGGTVLAIGGVADHVHLLVGMPARRAVSDWVRAVKACSSKWVNEQPDRDLFRWQPGYGAFSVSSARIPGVRHYIQRQEEHHRNRSHSDEVIAMCRAAGIGTPRDNRDASSARHPTWG